MKKTLIAAAVSALFVGGAQATVTISNTGSAGVPYFAQELSVPTSGLILSGQQAANAVDLRAALGFGITQGSETRYVLIQLQNANFVGEPTIRVVGFNQVSEIPAVDRTAFVGSIPVANVHVVELVNGDKVYITGTVTNGTAEVPESEPGEGDGTPATPGTFTSVTAVQAIEDNPIVKSVAVAEEVPSTASIRIVGTDAAKLLLEVDGGNAPFEVGYVGQDQGRFVWGVTATSTGGGIDPRSFVEIVNPELRVTSTNQTVTASFATFNDSVDATRGNMDRAFSGAISSQEYVRFAPVLNQSLISDTGARVDVRQASTRFANVGNVTGTPANVQDDNKQAFLGSLELSVARTTAANALERETGEGAANFGTAPIRLNTGAPITALNQVITNSVAEIRGDFSAALNEEGELTASMVTFGAAPAAKDFAADRFVVTNPATATQPLNLFYTVSGEDLIAAPVQYRLHSLQLTSVGGTNPTFNLQGTTGDLAELTKNGQSEDVELALTPVDSAFRNFVRITNLTNIAGDVTIRVFNDAGDNVLINLGDIEGFARSALGGNQSTALIDIRDIYAAAVAADSDFAFNEDRTQTAEGTLVGNKLRLVVEGEIGRMNVQTVTLSRDANSFSTF